MIDKSDLNINPFPALGNPNSPFVTIDPIGYEYDLSHRIEIINDNITHQPLLIPIIGEWGQGKSTILKFFEKKVLDNIYKINLRLENINDFKQNLIESYLKYEKKKDRYQGLIILLDEGQNLVREIGDIFQLKKETGKIAEKFISFLSDLRSFTDNNIEKIDSSKICLIFGLHPEIYKHIKEQAPDIHQRTHIHLLELNDINFYQAYEIINQIFKKKGLNIKDVFDNSVVYSIFALLPSINKKLEEIPRYNGRVFSQIFFELYEYWKKEKKKINLTDLKKILLGNINLKLGEIDIKIPDPQEYYKIINSSGYDPELFDYFIFNPTWLFKDEISPNLNFFFERYKNNLFIEREGYLLDYNEKRQIFKKLDSQLLDSLNNLDYEEIFWNNGHKVILFTEEYMQSQKEIQHFFKEYDFKKIIIFRLNDIILKKIYGFIPGLKSPYTNVLQNYFKKTPLEKVEQMRNIIKGFTKPYFTGKKVKDIETEEHKIPYLNFSYEFFKEKKNDISLFYYPKGWDLHLKEYLYIIKDKLKEDPNTDFIIIFCDPYVDKSIIDTIDKDEKISEFRKSNNRIFINIFDRNTLGNLLKNKDFNIFRETIENCRSSFFIESLNEGYLIPLTGIKLNSTHNNAHELLFSDIKTSIELEIDKKLNPLSYNEDKYEFFSIQGYKEGTKKGKISKKQTKKYIYIQGFPQRFIKSTLYQFFQFKEEAEKIQSLKIIGSKLSKYEKNILDIIYDKDLLKNKDFENIINKYYNVNSRIDPYIFLVSILELRNIIETEKLKGKIIRINLLKTRDMVNRIGDFISEREDVVNLLNENEKISNNALIQSLNNFKEQYNDEYDTRDYNTCSINNTYLKNIYEKFIKLFAGQIDHDVIIKEIIKLKEDIKNLFSSNIITFPRPLPMNKIDNLEGLVEEENKNFSETLIYLENIKEKNNHLKEFISSNKIEGGKKEFHYYFFIFLIDLLRKIYKNKEDDKFTEIVENCIEIYNNFFEYLFYAEITSNNESIEVGEFFNKKPRILMQLNDLLNIIKEIFEDLFNKITKIKIGRGKEKNIDLLFKESCEKIEKVNNYCILFQYIEDILEITFFKILFENSDFYKSLDKDLHFPACQFCYDNISFLKFYESKFISYINEKSIKKIKKFLTDFSQNAVTIDENLNLTIEEFIKSKLNSFLKQEYPFKNCTVELPKSLGQNFLKDLLFFSYNLNSFKNNLKEIYYYFFLFNFFNFLINPVKYLSDNEDEITNFLNIFDFHTSFDELYRNGLFIKVKSTETSYIDKEEKINDLSFIKPNLQLSIFSLKDFSKKGTLKNILKPDDLDFDTFKAKKIKEIEENFKKEKEIEQIKEWLLIDDFKELLKEYVFSRDNVFNKDYGEKIGLTKEELQNIIQFLIRNIELLDTELKEIYFLKNEMMKFA